jgi:hypothetical protein
MRMGLPYWVLSSSPVMPSRTPGASELLAHPVSTVIKASRSDKMGELRITRNST